MLKAFILCFLQALFIKISIAQTAKVSVDFISGPGKNQISMSTISDKYDPVNHRMVPISFVKNNSYYANITLAKPTFLSLSLVHDNDFLPLSIYLSPGDDLHYRVEFKKGAQTITVTGKGSNNNQPEFNKLVNIELDQFRKDTLPNRAIAAINKQYKQNKALLDGYANGLVTKDGKALNKYNTVGKPSADFLKAAQVNLKYFAVNAYYSYKENRKFEKMAAYKRNLGKWQKIQDSLFAISKLNNDAALSSYNYQFLLMWYMVREREHLYEEQDAHPEAFYKEWYHTDPARGRKLFANENHDLILEKVIDKQFSGKTAEYLHAQLIKELLYGSTLQNIGEVFKHFKQRYPHSSHIAELSAPVAAVLARQSAPLNSKMVFVANNGSKLNSMAEVLALCKGKTVLVDMWGTWCSPCRQDIEKQSAALHTYFKNKKVSFLYIANFDLEHEKQWKKIIPCYQLEGTHILASDKLTKDIMGKVKSTGYPTYIIIKKDGTFAKAKSQYPMNREAMISELEADAR